MQTCDRCDRLLLPGARRCPFCASQSVAAFGMALVAPLVLSACYGLPPCDDDERIDLDNDGYFATAACDLPEPTDCDDANPDVNPGQDEVCGDDLDNNCDGIIAGPDQAERCNGLDDDCDGAIDEDGACDTGTPTPADRRIEDP